MDEKYDVVIIGSGLGGLVSAVIMAREGRSVCLVEKNQQYGGNLQTFVRDRTIFDTGVHYIGGLSEGQNLHRYFSYLGILDDLRLKRMDESGFDVISFDNDPVSYYHAQGYDRFAESLIGQFPDEEKAIRAYCRKMQETCDNFPLYRVKSEGDAYRNPGFFNESVKGFLDSITGNEKLKSVLAGSNLLYAGNGRKTPMYVHALSVNSYIESSYRLVRGGSQITKALLKRFRELGGKAYSRQEVVKLESENGLVKAVHTSKGKRIEGAVFISNITPDRTLELLGAEHFRKSFVSRVRSMKNTIAPFSLFLVLKPGYIPYFNCNYYHFKNHQAVWTATEYDEPEWPEAYMISMGINNEDTRWSDNISVLTYMRYEEVAEWGASFNTVVHPSERPEAYEKFKKEKSEVLISELEKKFPEIREAIQSVYAATPLSYRDYIGSNEGAMYGYEKNAENPMRAFISPRTKVKNLFFTGQSLNMHGVLGVTISGVVTCSEILGKEYLLNKIKEQTQPEKYI